MKGKSLTSRLLLLRAGSAANNNLIHSLKAGDPSLIVVGCNDDPFALIKSRADVNYLVPPFANPEFARALRRLIKPERIDLVIPNSDADVGMISALRGSLACRIFLPRKSVIERCQDKYALTRFLGGLGLPVALTYPVTNLSDIEKLFGRFAPRTRLWCRIRRGTGSWGTIPVTSPEQVRSWIKYWQEMRGVPAGQFTLSEFLPGRDFCLQSLWSKGTLVMAKAHERLTYHVTGGSPSGTSSTAGLAKMVFDPRVATVCAKCIRTLDPKASGVFFIDLKENGNGVPCITEINAGRFANVPTIHDSAGNYNMAAAYVRLALGERVASRAVCRFTDECYITRDIDMPPKVFSAVELLQGWEDASGWGGRVAKPKTR